MNTDTPWEPPDPRFLYSRPRWYDTRFHPIVLLGLMVALAAGVVAVMRALHDEPYVPPTVIQPAAATALRPFVLGPSTCLGTVSQRVQVEASRSNDGRIPIPFFGDIPVPFPGEDHYHANVVLEADLCVDGVDGIGDDSAVRAVTTAEGITVTVNQAAGMFSIEPRVNARQCTAEEWAANDPCMSLGGGPSNATKVIELMPFTASGNNLLESALAAAQVYAYNPECLQRGFRTITGTDFYDVLLATFRWQAQQQGLAVDIVNLILLDTEGRPTREWDDRRQEAEFRREYAHLADTLDDGTTLSYSNDCDVTGFGLSAPGSIAPTAAPASPDTGAGAVPDPTSPTGSFFGEGVPVSTTL